MAKLKKANRTCWVDKTNLPIGATFNDGIADALWKASSVIVILTKESMQSEYVTYEWSFALGARKPLIPLLFEEGIRLHPVLALRQYLDFSGNPRQWDWRRLIGSIGESQSPEKEAKMNTSPAIYATFSRDEDGRLEYAGEQENEYVIDLKIINVPADTTAVRYEILYEGFDDNPWTETSEEAGPAFGTWMSSYGDVFMTANGIGGSSWRAYTALSQALRLGEGNDPPPEIKRAIEEIEDN